MTQKTVEKRVEIVFKHHPEAIDDDNKLVYLYCNYLLKKLRGVSLKDIPASSFFELFLSGFFPKPESITRAGRLIRAKNEKLRGERYEERKEVLEPEHRDYYAGRGSNGVA